MDAIDSAVIDRIIGEVSKLRATVNHLEKLETPVSAGGGGGYVTSHAVLTNLDYSAAGHTGFQPTVSWPLAAIAGGTGIANPAGATLTLPNAAIELAGGGASATLTLPNAPTTVTGGGTLGLGTFTLTVAGTASVIGTNTGDVTLASPDHGLGLTNQVITLGTPSTLTTITTNGVTTTTHAHAVTNSANPGAAASILASDANGYLTLVKLMTDTLADRSGGNLVVSPAGDLILNPVGYVGIGTTSPAAMLDIYKYTATLQDGPAIRLTRDYTGNDYGSAIYDGWGGALGDVLVFGVSSGAVAGGPEAAGNERMVITSTGYVGIGTTTPGAKLDVAGGITETGVININRTIGDVQSISFNNSDGNDWYIDAYGGRLRFHEYTPANIERMTIIAGGNIGINNTAPNARLEVTTSGGTETLLKFSLAAYPDVYFNTMKVVYSGASAAANKFTIGYSNGYTNGDALTIQGDGNIGIGTTAPTHKLEVDGDLAFVGAQSILTTADSLTLAPAADLDLTPGGTARVRATSGVRLQSDNYVSQTTGWGISYLGSGDFRYLYADEMHVKAFIADLEQALAGGQIISKSVAPLAVDFVTPAPEAAAPLVVESFKGFDTFRVFVDDDMIRLRQFERGQTTTNLITNPSFEVDLAGWSTSGGTRIVGYTRFGMAYLNAGSVTWIGATITNATVYTFSFYCKGDYNLILDPGNGAYYSVAGYADPESDGWVRVTHTFTSLGTAFVVYLYTHNYDAIQLELGASATSYCDGSLGAGYHWNGTPHASTSYRGGVLDISNCWGTVVWVSTDSTAKTQTYTFTRSAVPNAGAVITGAVIGAGTLALDYGTTGNGYLESNAMDGAQAEYAPYHQIVSWATHPNSGLTVRTRLGNLKGIFNTANEYGLYAGAGITDADQYLRISNTAVEAHNLPIKMYDGASVTMQLSPTAPSFAMGSTLPSAYGTGDGLWMGKDTAYKFRVGDVDGEMFAWDGSYLYLKADVNNYLKVTGTTLQFWANAQLMLEIANTPAIALGLLSGPNVSITSAGIQIRNATTERIGMTSAGVMTINDSAGAAVITLNASVGAEITKKLTMPGANSAIAIGSTPPTSATVGTGLWLDRTGLYGLAANVLQAKMSATDGKITAGAGVVTLNVDGIAVASTTTPSYVDDNAYKFTSGGVSRGGLYSRVQTVLNDLTLRIPRVGSQIAQLWITTDADIGTNSNIYLEAYQEGGTGAGIHIYGYQQYIDFTKALWVAIGDGSADITDLRVDGGLYVGNIATDPAAGTAYIKLSDAATNTYPYLLTLNHATSDTPVAGFGSAIIYRGETSGAGAAEDVPQSQMMSQWVVADHATRTAKWTLQVVDTAARTVMIGEASGTAPKVAFLGAAAVVQAAHIPVATDLTTAIDRIAALEIVLENLGFVATS